MHDTRGHLRDGGVALEGRHLPVAPNSKTKIDAKGLCRKVTATQGMGTLFDHPRLERKKCNHLMLPSPVRSLDQALRQPAPPAGRLGTLPLALVRSGTSI